MERRTRDPDDPTVPVLIAGAGPTGLLLAIVLARYGVSFRIVDENPGPGTQSRAMVVQARTLEFYRQLGFADEVIAEGIRVERGHLRETHPDGTGREVLSFAFGDLGTGLSPFPFALAYPQDDHERLLLRTLRGLGHDVEWNTPATSLTQDASGVDVTLGGAGAERRVRAAYVCGCDGARSMVRRAIGTDFGGGTYEQRYFVADVRIDGGFERDLILNLGRDAFTLLIPVRSAGTQRLIGLIPPEIRSESPGFAEIRAQQEALIGRRIAAVDWFSTYRVHHRVADRFQRGRAFLLGDAGHLHSPTGGQGMNTGLGDAFNLGWKLAAVIGGRADAKLLETYEAERIGFARSLVATTDRAFTQIVAGGIAGDVVRRLLLPAVFRVATSTAAGRRTLFRVVSQTRIAYRESALSARGLGRVRAGDRLPWAGDADNFAPLASLRWQVHVYGDPAAGIGAWCSGHGLHLVRFPWTATVARAGFRRDAAYLIRPDGHVALAIAPGASAQPALDTYCARFSLRFGTNGRSD